MKTYRLDRIALLLMTLLSFLSPVQSPASDPSCLGGQVDFLYWRPCVDGIYVALKTATEITFEGIVITDLERQRRLSHPSDGWSGGFRLGLNYEKPGCTWDAALSWAHYSPSMSKTTRLDDFSMSPFSVFDVSIISEPFNFRSFFIDPLYTTDPYGGGTYQTIKGNWDLDLNIVDLEVGHRFCIGECFHLRPTLALRYLSLDQEYTVKSEGILDAPSDFLQKETFCRDFWGIGPRLGFDAEWTIGCGWGVFGSVAASIVYGERDSTDTIRNTRLNSADPRNDTDDIKMRRHADRYCSRAGTDLEAGVFWEKCLSSGKELILKASWEHHYFFNQSVADASLNPWFFNVRNENLDVSTQGVTISAGLGF